VNDIEIDKALAASGECDACNGGGTVYEYDGRVPCRQCGGSGCDPRVALRATQAVGHLLLRLLDRAERQ